MAPRGREPGPRPSRGAVLAALAAVVLLGAGLRLRSAWGELAPPRGDALHYFSLGASLRVSGVLAAGEEPRQPSAFRAPLYPAFLALVGRADPSPRAARLALALLDSATVLLVFQLGRVVLSTPCGLLAALAYAAHPWPSRSVAGLGVEPLFAFFLTAAALALAAWRRSPSRGAEAAAGAMLGFSLLARSTLFLFPPAAAALARRAGRRTAWLLLALSYLPLAPWAARNFAHWGRFIPLERHAATANIYSASLGSVRHLVPGASVEESEVRLRLAGRNIARDPAGYLAGCLRRAAVLTAFLGQALGGVGLALGAWAAWRLRRDPAASMLAAVCGYFLLIHVPMSISERYLEPLLPASLVLAAAGAAELLRSVLPREAPSPGGGPVLRASVLAGGGLFAWCALVLGLEPAAARRARLAPASPFEEGVLLTERGDLEAALAALDRGLAREPGAARRLAARGVALQLAGRGEAAREALRAAVDADPGDADARLNLAVALREGGQERRARETVDAALALLEGPRPHAPSGGGEERVWGMVVLGAGDLHQLPPDGIPWSRLSVWLELLAERGHLRAAQGDAEGARADLRRALDLAPEGWRRAEELRAVLRGLDARGPG